MEFYNTGHVDQSKQIHSTSSEHYIYSDIQHRHTVDMQIENGGEPLLFRLACFA